jgi:flagellar biosynthetic protein FliR
VEQFGLVFSYGVLIVAPSVIVMLLLDVGLSIAARTMPQMNIFIVAMPLKVFVGLLTLALSLRTMPLALRRVFDSMPHYWQRLFA